MTRKQKWILRLLNWPLIWHIAVRWAREYPHAENTAACLPCAAKKRANRDEHRMKLVGPRTYICAACGLPLGKWLKHPKCKGLPPYVPPVPSSEPVIIRTFWE